MFIDPVKRNPTSTSLQPTKVDFGSLVNEISGMQDFGSKARQATASIGDIRKAELAKELYPTALKVCCHCLFRFYFLLNK